MSFGSFNTCYALSVSSPPRYYIATRLATSNPNNIGTQLDSSKHTLVPGSTKYVYHTFTSNGTSSQTPYTFTMNSSADCSILIVAGGGAGGGVDVTYNGWNADYGTYAGGGGGGGGVIYIDKIFLKAGTYNICVGLGGNPKAGSTNPYYDTSGNNSSFISSDGLINYTSIGGGYGGCGSINNGSGGDGGSGGGGGCNNTFRNVIGGNRITNQGNNGGLTYVTGTGINTVYVGGGGGGAGGEPGDKYTNSGLIINGINIAKNQVGGIGVNNNINPTFTNKYGCGGNGGVTIGSITDKYNSYFYFGYGGGTLYQYTNFAHVVANYLDGIDNYGGGGAGGFYGNTSGKGGSGVVIVSYYLK